jgi:phosphoglycerate dehydrogenase-like enzyme
VGIIGTGKIGAALQKSCSFGCKILACDPEQNGTNPANRYKHYTRRGLCYSDIISVHCPLNLKQNTCSTKGPLA